MTRLSIPVAGVFSVAVLFVATSVSAQVAVGPGSVTAPFVHVEWGHGHVHVCAPFVNLDVALPICCHESPCESTQPRQPTSAYSTNSQELAPRDQLSASAAQLYGALARFRTADLWQHYLAVAPRETLRNRNATVTVSEAHNPNSGADDLEAALDRFDATANSDEYPMISSLPEFQQTRRLLARFLAQRDQPRAADTARWSPTSRQPYVGLPGFGSIGPAPSIAPEELPTPPAPHSTSSVMVSPQN